MNVADFWCLAKHGIRMKLICFQRPVGKEASPRVWEKLLAQTGCVISSLILSQRNRNEGKANTEKSLGLEGGVWGVVGPEE